jgi:hypothetical protein
MGEALAWPMKKYYSEKAWAKLAELLKDAAERERRSQARADLYRAIAAALEEGPRNEKAQGLVTRSIELFELDSDGDPGIKAGARKAMADRKNWPVWMKRQVASRHQLTFEAFDRVAAFLDRARASRRRAKAKK